MGSRASGRGHGFSRLRGRDDPELSSDTNGYPTTGNDPARANGGGHANLHARISNPLIPADSLGSFGFRASNRDTPAPTPQRGPTQRQV
jgi:hypothetical protein